MNLQKIVLLALLNVFIVFNAPSPHTFMTFNSKEAVVGAHLLMIYALVSLTSWLSMKYYAFNMLEMSYSFILFYMAAYVIYVYDTDLRRLFR